MVPENGSIFSFSEEMIIEYNSSANSTSNSNNECLTPLVLIKITGRCLHESVENAVSGYPKLEGRFPQVSGVTFAFDPSKPTGHRVDPQLIQVGDEHLTMEQTYKACIRSCYNGFDSFIMCNEAKALVGRLRLSNG
ncbi:hypothetical protein GQX74_015280 [Glossina fuscipes]|nr:hypothetical protein GQX74_015280 [Glossina fuscipes]